MGDLSKAIEKLNIVRKANGDLGIDDDLFVSQMFSLLDKNFSNENDKFFAVQYFTEQVDKGKTSIVENGVVTIPDSLMRASKVHVEKFSTIEHRRAEEVVKDQENFEKLVGILTVAELDKFLGEYSNLSYDDKRKVWDSYSHADRKTQKKIEETHIAGLRKRAEELRKTDPKKADEYEKSAEQEEILSDLIDKSKSDDPKVKKEAKKILDDMYKAEPNLYQMHEDDNERTMSSGEKIMKSRAEIDNISERLEELLENGSKEDALAFLENELEYLKKFDSDYEIDSDDIISSLNRASKIIFKTKQKQIDNFGKNYKEELKQDFRGEVDEALVSNVPSKKRQVSRDELQTILARYTGLSSKDVHGVIQKSLEAVRQIDEEAFFGDIGTLNTLNIQSTVNEVLTNDFSQLTENLDGLNQVDDVVSETAQQFDKPLQEFFDFLKNDFDEDMKSFINSKTPLEVKEMLLEEINSPERNLSAIDKAKMEMLLSRYNEEEIQEILLADDRREKFVGQLEASVRPKKQVKSFKNNDKFKIDQYDDKNKSEKFEKISNEEVDPVFNNSKDRIAIDMIEEFNRTQKDGKNYELEIVTEDKSALAKKAKEVKTEDQEQVEETDKKPDKEPKEEETVDSATPKSESVLGKSMNDMDIFLSSIGSATKDSSSYLKKLFDTMGAQQSQLSQAQTTQTQSNDGKDENQPKSTSTPGEKNNSDDHEEK